MRPSFLLFGAFRPIFLDLFCWWFFLFTMINYYQTHHLGEYFSFFPSARKSEFQRRTCGKIIYWGGVEKRLPLLRWVWKASISRGWGWKGWPPAVWRIGAGTGRLGSVGDWEATFFDRRFGTNKKTSSFASWRFGIVLLLFHTVDGSEVRQENQLKLVVYHHSEGFIHPWWCRISSINSRAFEHVLCWGGTPFYTIILESCPIPFRQPCVFTFRWGFCATFLVPQKKTFNEIDHFLKPSSPWKKPKKNNIFLRRGASIQFCSWKKVWKQSVSMI